MYITLIKGITSWVSRLNHKAFDISMKSTAIVVVTSTESQKILRKEPESQLRNKLGYKTFYTPMTSLDITAMTKCCA